jgi:hypothetical protein
LTFISKERIDSVILPKQSYSVPVIIEKSLIVVPNLKLDSSSRSSTVQENEVSKSNTNSYNPIVSGTIEIPSVKIVKEKKD